MPKLLGEFLQEQQEPFALDIYLFERGFRNRRARSFKKRDAVANCVEFAKAAFRRLILQTRFRKAKTKSCYFPGNRNGQEHKPGTKQNSIFLEEKKVYANGNTKHGSETESNDEGSSTSSLHETNYDFTTKTRCEDESSTSKTKPKRPMYSDCARKSSRQVVRPNSYYQYTINKRALHETKRLLIDCLREVIENHRKIFEKRRRHQNEQQLKRIVGTEELWQLVCENVWVWSKNSIHETNILVLLNYDFLDSEEEWTSLFELQKEEIAMEISEAILEGIIIAFTQPTAAAIPASVIVLWRDHHPLSTTMGPAFTTASVSQTAAVWLGHYAVEHHNESNNHDNSSSSVTGICFQSVTSRQRRPHPGQTRQSCDGVVGGGQGPTFTATTPCW
ncbi:Unknown protein [Striga hermonthica]|uniref:Uncharacterized protein n=1 Tax=Striga hermonthica TaxID=68872 RepID=A0A9N7MKP5_STRHE|nr:Unknown protein [Striga hermonthica]